MRLLFWPLAAIALNGCLATGGTMVRTTPPDALVTVPGFGECQSPCTVKLSQTRRVTIAKAGYKPVRIDMAPGAADINVTLQLAAPTDDVDAVGLPDL